MTAPDGRMSHQMVYFTDGVGEFPLPVSDQSVHPVVLPHGRVHHTLLDGSPEEYDGWGQPAQDRVSAHRDRGVQEQEAQGHGVQQLGAPVVQEHGVPADRHGHESVHRGVVANPI